MWLFLSSYDLASSSLMSTNSEFALAPDLHRDWASLSWGLGEKTPGLKVNNCCVVAHLYTTEPLVHLAYHTP